MSRRRSRTAWARLRSFRPLAGALVAGVVAMLVASATFGDTVATPEPISLSGAGSWAVFRELTAWQNALSDAPQPVDLQYTPHGTLLGRSDFLNGDADFVLSGTPFTSDELSQLPDGAKDLISAPVAVASMAFLVTPPFPGGFATFTLLCDPNDPNVDDPSQCFSTTPYKGDTRPAYPGELKVPTDNLAAMLLRNTDPCVAQSSGGGAPVTDSAHPMNGWSCLAIFRAFGLPDDAQWSGLVNPTAAPAPVVRSDGDEMNQYLQQYIKQQSPGMWSRELEIDGPKYPWDPPSERFARVKSASRDGADAQVLMLGQDNIDPASGASIPSSAGILAPVPVSALGDLKDTYPHTKATLIEVQVGNDYIGPSTDSINANVDAAAKVGADPFLYSMDHPVPNAYPLSWIDNVYVKASGLSPQKTEAMATMIRYLATDGQAEAKAAGEGQLPPELVQKALAAADQVVRSNCPKASVVTNTDPGPDAPDGPGMKAIGTMLHCVGSTSSTTTTAPTPTTFPSAGAFSSPAFSNPVLTPLPAYPNGATAPGGTAGSTPTKESKQLQAALAASKLPLPEPDSSGNIDRVATLLAGAGLYLLLRNPFSRLVHRILG